MRKANAPTSFYLSDTARTLLREIAEYEGISMSAVLEMAIRELARKREIKLNEHSINADK